MPEQWQHELRKLKRLDPPPGLWDRAVLGSPREPPRMRRTSHGIAPIAAAMAIAVVAAGTFALVRAFRPAARGPGSAGDHRPGRFVDPSLGWTIRVPAGLTARGFRSTARVTSDGVRVTSFPPDLQVPSTGTPPMGWLRRFPADGVAVQIWSSEGGPAGPPPLRDSTFPLSPSSFHRIRPYAAGSEPHPWYRGFYGDGFGFTAAVWLGPQASHADQQAAWAVVRSLRFPRLREGTFWHGTYYVLGPASRYPMGSVTTLPRSSLPGGRAVSASHVPKGFYLIHAPRAFYVIHRLFQKPAKPYTRCTLAFGRKAFQFYCPGTNLRWNRTGQPVGAHAGSGPDWDLPLVPATVAHDGHILFSPFWGGVLRVDLQGSPWGSR